MIHECPLWVILKSEAQILHGRMVIANFTFKWIDSIKSSPKKEKEKLTSLVINVSTTKTIDKFQKPPLDDTPEVCVIIISFFHFLNRQRIMGKLQKSIPIWLKDY